MTDQMQNLTANEVIGVLNDKGWLSLVLLVWKFDWDKTNLDLLYRLREELPRLQASMQYNWNDKSKFFASKMPDICCECYSFYGFTVGGRLRTGCPACQTRQGKGWRKRYLFRDISGLADHYAEVVIIRALYYYFRTGSYD